MENSFSTQRPALIAICGVDGTGKTSLIENLASKEYLKGIRCVRRGSAPCESAVERFGFRKTNDYRDWLEGTFSKAIAAACAFDFLGHYEATLIPLLADSSISAIITDRYSYCFSGYNECLDHPDEVAEALLSVPRAPDLVIYLEISEETALARIRARGEEVVGFEMPECQRRFRSGYEATFRKKQPRVQRVSAEADFDVVLETVARIIDQEINARSVRL